MRNLEPMRNVITLILGDWVSSLQFAGFSLSITPFKKNVFHVEIEYMFEFSLWNRFSTRFDRKKTGLALISLRILFRMSKFSMTYTCVTCAISSWYCPHLIRKFTFFSESMVNTCMAPSIFKCSCVILFIYFFCRK